MQDAADGMVMDLMREYNKDAAYIYNTIQFYRHDRLEYLMEICDKARSEGFRIGIKAVRGAYMEKENERAEKLGLKVQFVPRKKLRTRILMPECVL